MASPFAGFQDMRIRLVQSPAVMTLRDGPSGGGPPEVVVVELFAKGQGSSGSDRPSIEICSGAMGGFIVRWAALEQGQDWLTHADHLSWDDTGLRPAALRPGATCQAYLGDLTILPLRDGGLLGELEMAELGQPFGVGGIGKLIREAAGDKWAGTFKLSR